MKTSTLKNRLEKVENLSKNSKAYQVVNAFISNERHAMIFGNIIRPCHISGKGRFCSNLDYTSNIKYILDKIGVKYESGNDSSRGGLTGNYIKITSKIQ